MSNKYEVTEELLNNTKAWYALSCPVAGLRFDARTLAFLDADHDGHIRTPEVEAAVALMRKEGVTLAQLKKPDPADEQKLADVLARAAALDSEPPTEDEARSLADWEAKGKTAEVAVLGENTEAAEAALAAVEGVVDAFFTPPEDMPLVTEDADVVLPLAGRLNPKYEEAIADFAAKCVKPILGERGTLTRLEWKRVKAAFAAFRAWRAAKPVTSAAAKARLEDEERIVRYRLYLGAFLENYVTMARLYDVGSESMFQTGELRIDGRAMKLCFHVTDEAAHADLSGRSGCCVLYVKLTRADLPARTVCAVVTAGRISPLYVGRNGVFFDCEGRDWDAVVTKVVENPVSLAEAFWAPWRKIGTGAAAAIKKMIGDKHTKTVANVATASMTAGTQSTQAGAAALASSVAAVGIGIGMVGAAAASIVTAIKGLQPWWMIFVALAALLLIVSLPSVILAWLKLRRRDIGAVLNAGGWAVNRQLRLTIGLARRFTSRCRAK